VLLDILEFAVAISKKCVAKAFFTEHLFSVATECFVSICKHVTRKVFESLKSRTQVRRLDCHCHLMRLVIDATKRAVLISERALHRSGG